MRLTSHHLLESVSIGVLFNQLCNYSFSTLSEYRMHHEIFHRFKPGKNDGFVVELEERDEMALMWEDYQAFKLLLYDPDALVNTLTREVKEIAHGELEVTKMVPVMAEEINVSVIKNIRRCMVAHPLKTRADNEMKCLQVDGVLHIKSAIRKFEYAVQADFPMKVKLVAPPVYVLTTQTIEKSAMRKSEAAGIADFPVKIKLIALFVCVLTTQTLDKKQGISVLTNAIQACSEKIDCHKGRHMLKEAPRAVSEHDDRRLAECMQNEELAMNKAKKRKGELELAGCRSRSTRVVV